MSEEQVEMADIKFEIDPLSEENDLQGSDTNNIDVSYGYQHESKSASELDALFHTIKTEPELSNTMLAKKEDILEQNKKESALRKLIKINIVSPVKYTISNNRPSFVRVKNMSEVYVKTSPSTKRKIRKAPDSRFFPCEIECPHCDRVYITQSDLKKHLKTHPKADSVPCDFECPHCDKVYIIQTHLEEHLQTHPEANSVPCVQQTEPEPFETALVNKEDFLEDRKKESTLGKLIKTYVVSSVKNTNSDKHSNKSTVKTYSSKRINNPKGRVSRFASQDMECTHCSKVFIVKSHFEEHLKTHSGANSFSCGHCSEVFSSESDLTLHLKTHPTNTPYSCPVCGKGFIYKATLNLHLTSHSTANQFKCEICGNCFSTQFKLTSHLRSHTEKNSLSCDTCGRSFLNKENLKKHIPIHSRDKKIFSCSICWNGFTRNSTLEKHMKIFHSGKTMTCNTCGETFKHIKVFRRHVKNHSKLKPLLCSICGMGYFTKVRLARHLRTHASESLTCKTCGKVFEHEFNLKRHVSQYHSETNKFSCTVCRKIFASKIDLSTHMNDHNCLINFDIRKLSCIICKERFDSKADLTTHKKCTHPGVKSFSCTSCNKSFDHVNMLRKHILLHPFKCSVCGNHFHRKLHFKNHMKVHPGSNTNTDIDASLAQHHDLKSSQLDSSSTGFECDKIYSEIDVSHSYHHESKSKQQLDELFQPIKTEPETSEDAFVIKEEILTQPNEESTSGVIIKTNIVSSIKKVNSDKHPKELQEKCMSKGKLRASSNRRKCTKKSSLASKNFLCNKCSKVFILKSHLDEHVKIHAGES